MFLVNQTPRELTPCKLSKELTPYRYLISATVLLKKKIGFAGISKPAVLLLTFQIIYPGQSEHETSTLLKYFRFIMFI